MAARPVFQVLKEIAPASASTTSRRQAAASSALHLTPEHPAINASQATKSTRTASPRAPTPTAATARILLEGTAAWDVAASARIDGRATRAKIALSGLTRVETAGTAPPASWATPIVRVAAPFSTIAQIILSSRAVTRTRDAVATAAMRGPYPTAACALTDSTLPTTAARALTASTATRLVR